MDPSSDFGSECDIFNLSFSSFNADGGEDSPSSSTHIGQPTVPRRFICQDCGKVFRSSRTVTRHRQQHVAVSGRPGYPQAEGHQMMRDVLRHAAARTGNNWQNWTLDSEVAQSITEISDRFWYDVANGTLEKLWMCITSGEMNILPDQYRQSIWKGFDDLLKSEFYLSLTASVSSMLTVDEPATAAQLFCSRFLRRFLQKLISYRLAYKPTPCNTVPQANRTPMEEKALYHVCGYVLHTLIKKCARYSKSDKYKCILSCIKKTFLALGVSRSDMINIQSWTRKQDRGALKCVSMNFFYFLRHLEDIAVKKQSVQGIRLRYRDILEAAFVDLAILYYWSLLTSHLVSETTRISMFEYVVKCFLSLRGHAVAKKFKRVHDQKKHEGARKKALRQKLKRQHETLKSSN